MVRLGLGVAVVAAALDRLCKWLLVPAPEGLDLFGLSTAPLEVTPFFNLAMVWNTGMSFGLLQRDWPYLQWLFSAIAAVIVVALVLWLRKVGERWPAAAIGLVIGGAVGNVLDRVVFGAVADFFDFHVAGYHWPAFNVADAAIVVGVAILLLNGLFAERERHK